MSQIPHPENPFHVDNLRTIPLLEAQGFAGNDASLDISLFEYDCIWREIPHELRNHPDEDYVFVFNVGKFNVGNWDQFARVGMTSSDFYADYSWIKAADWESFFSSHGISRDEWFDLPYPERVTDLLRYWGWMNVFDSTAYTFDIRDPQHDYESNPMPGESTDDYYARLISDDNRGGEAWIPQDFIRTETGVWFASPDFGNWMCQWHNNMDKAYAVGSSVIANHEVPLDVVRDAITVMERNHSAKIASDELYDAVQAQILIEVMKQALDAKPSEETQQTDI